MKKRIGIFSLIIFIIIVLGITISNGASTLTVTANTTAEAMLKALAEGKELTGNWYTIKSQNDNLFCIERYWPLFNDAKYKADGNLVKLPGNETNGHAKAYILAAPGYVMEDNVDIGGDITPSDERQYAWHHITGEKKGEANALYNIAIAYQNYKNSESKIGPITVTRPTDEETTIVGNNAIYGPIKIEYAYGECSSGNKKDEWGGFFYAFFDKNNENITDKIKLCELINGKYTPITAELITSGEGKGYYQIKTNDYKNKDLYAVTNDFSVGKVSLKIRENKVEYGVEIQKITGSVWKEANYKHLCSSCAYKEASATTDKAEAVDTGKLLKVDNSYYEYTGSTPATKTGKNNEYKINGTYSPADSDGVTFSYYYWVCGCTGESCNKSKHIYEVNLSSYHTHKCGLCGLTASEGEVIGHPCTFNNYKTAFYDKKIYNFEPFTGCGYYKGDKKGICGVGPGVACDIPSQDLEIIKTTIDNSSREIVEDFEIEFLTSVSVKKVWEDNENQYQNRPDKIVVELFADGVSTEKTLELNSGNGWSITFEELDVTNAAGEEINYTIKEKGVPVGYTPTITGDQKNGYTITNKPYDGYIEITGKVWVDSKNGKSNTINGVYDNDDFTLGGIKVRLFDKAGNSIASTYSDKDGNFTGTEFAETKSDGTYTIRVSYDNSNKVYKLHNDLATVRSQLDEAYVEFEYDGLTYTTLAANINTSKAIEDEGKRNEIDTNYSTINSTGEEKQYDRIITASTQSVITSFNTYQKMDNGKYVEINGRDETVEYCDGTNYECSNPNGADGEVITSGHTHSNCPIDEKFKVDVITIKNVDLGLMIREQPDVKIDANIDRVEVETNNEKYTYIYNAVVTNEQDVGVQVQFQNKQSYTYRRPVNPSDIAYFKELKGEDTDTLGSDIMKVFVTYKVSVSNEADTLIAKINSIINCFDDRYQLDRVTMNNAVVPYEQSKIYDIDDSEETQFSEIKLTGLNITLNAKKSTSDSDIQSDIFLRYRVESDAILGLLDNDATLSNAFEIESYSTYYGEGTVYAEQREYKTTEGNKNLKDYGAYDKDSHPGNAAIKVDDAKYTYMEKEYNEKVLKSTENLVEYRMKDNEGNEVVAWMPEDDTDIAPSFLLCKDETPKILSGTVFEDTNVKDKGERVGDGKYYSSTEKIIQNVKVELYEAGSTERAQLYKYGENGNIEKDDAGKFKLIDAVQYTSESGNYAFNGVITGKEYYLKFTYGDNTEVLTQGATTIINPENPDLPAVNARNYKSTIIADEILKGIMQSDATDFDKYWYIKIYDNNSVAVDNMLDRLQIEDLQYSNFHKNGDGTTYIKPENMTAYSKSFIIPVEFAENAGDENAGANVEDNSGSIGKSNNLSKLDFGIIERPREDLFVEKTISNIKITLANGQKLIDGDPRKDNLNYVKAMGFQETITNGSQARKVGNKRLLAELDAELTQGAQLDISYEVKVTNNNEIDYDYGSSGDYTDITGNNYITTSNTANYYYYGENPGSELKATLQVVDYMSSNISYGENANWTKVDVETLHQPGDAQLISDDAYNAIKEKCIVLQPKEGEGLITLGRGETSNTLTMNVSKLLTSQADNVYDNHAEIIKIDGKTARTIQFADGVLKEKTYYPGNYEPGADTIDEQDDDGAQVIITPPTGIIDIIIYVAAGLVGLIVIAGGIMFIKKKVLTK